MKQLIAMVLTLMAVFFMAWAIKIRVPVSRPENLDTGDAAYWYEENYSAPVSDVKWKLDPTIPDNYIPVPGESDLFMIVDDAGKITGYSRREQLPDGTWKWEKTNPDIPENYQKVEGKKDVYMVTDEEGNVSYFLYVRNEDDTFCFVPVDENGVPLDLKEDAEKIDTSRYIHQTGNIYALYNNDGVLTGYRERVKEEDGSFSWIQAQKPSYSVDLPDDFGNTAYALPSVPDIQTDESQRSTSGTDAGQNIVQGADSTYTETERTLNTVTENGERITYETDAVTTYDMDGSVLYTRQEGPYEVIREKAGGISGNPNPDLIADTIEGELARVSAYVSFDTDKAGDLLAKLNAQRADAGLSALASDTGSAAYRLACIRAADMAIYDHGAVSSPMYGTVNDMAARWNIPAVSVYENVLKTPVKSADFIHLRFYSDEVSRNNMLSESITSVGIAVVEKNGQDYVAEVFL